MGDIKMGSLIFIMILNLLIPLTMIGFGKLFMNTPPKTINSAFGYRTPMSMKNKDTWEFAHRHNGNIWFKTGCVLLVLTIASILFLVGKNEDIIGNYSMAICILQLVFLIGSIFPTEIALRKNFDKNGNRKN